MNLVVSQEEAGQKLLQFLERRLELSPSMLHKWIRTGQVRLNKGRVKAFERVQAGDEVRLPPFAALPEQNSENKNLILPLIIAETSEFLLLNKPAGLPVHGGSGHEQSIVSYLKQAYANAVFMPSLVHRLDKSSSGLLLIAKSYAFLRKIQDGLSGRTDLPIYKEYLAWVEGVCPWDEIELQDNLQKGAEKMQIVEEGQFASLKAKCIRRQAKASLLHILLQTGRTHQIRVQLSNQGLPLIGDLKYQGPVCKQGLLLHAVRLSFEDQVFAALPVWTSNFAVTQLPEAYYEF